MEIWSDQHMLYRISGGELGDVNYILHITDQQRMSLVGELGDR